VQQIDISIDAQILMSAMARTNERFGIVHIIDIVIGADTARIRELGHHELKTFGAGRDRDKNHWRFIVNELLAQELIRQDGDRYPILKLTPRGAAALTGKEEVFGLKREDVKAKERRRKTADEGVFDEVLFERLRIIRKRIAGANRVPPYIIFSDKTLHEMCRHFPKTASEMRRISGVGDVKLERYAEDFIAEIRTYRAHGAQKQAGEE
jgi:ATP-dependent DNA helicase RecQ